MQGVNPHTNTPPPLPEMPQQAVDDLDEKAVSVVANNCQLPAIPAAVTAAAAALPAALNQQLLQRSSKQQQRHLQQQQQQKLALAAAPTAPR